MSEESTLFDSEQDEDSPFVPMTDMIVSFLFIMMILVAFFALHYTDQISAAETSAKDAAEQNATNTAKILELNKKVQSLTDQVTSLESTAATNSPLEQYYNQAEAVQNEILLTLESEMKDEFNALLSSKRLRLRVVGDALRFEGEGLFDPDSYTLEGERREMIQHLATVLLNAVECYSINQQRIANSRCGETSTYVEAIQIEGHTDDLASDEYNLRLSTDRARAAFLAMKEARPDFLQFLNTESQPLVAVAGYGEMRPVAPNTEEFRDQNRRIDVRILMFSPRSVEELRAVRNRMENQIKASTATQND